MAEAAADLKAAVYKRASVKGQVTRFRTFLDQCARDGKFAQIRIRLQKFREQWEAFNEIQTEIEILDGSQISERDPFENSYFEAIEVAEGLLSERATTSHSPVSEIPDIANSISNIRLPTINLPTFSGRYDEWTSFIDTFQNVVDNNTGISAVQKFHYLKSCLKSEAACTIQALESSSANYRVALNLLRERYDNRRVIVQTHIRHLFELPALSKESAIGLRSLLDETLKHVRALKALDQPTEAWDAILVHLITAKLDRNTLREWERSIDGSVLPRIEDLWKLLRNRCNALESLGVERGSITHKNCIKNTQQLNASTRPSQAFVGTQHGSPCPVCKREHGIQCCATFNASSYEDKIAAVRRAKLCFNCLRAGHRIEACKSGHCRKCDRKHHTLLHIDRAKELVAPPKQVDEEKNAHSENNSANLHVAMTTQVILSTAIVQIDDINGKTHNCKILLDPGSQSNFITQRLASELKLPLRKVKIPVSGFNQAVTQIDHAVTATINSKDGRFSSTLTFLVSPKITGLLPIETINKRTLNIPANIMLADPDFHKPAEIEALIGAEIFYTLLCVGQIKLDNRTALLQKTKLGWIVAGRIHDTLSRTTRCYLSVDDLAAQIQKFWTSEEVERCKYHSPEEVACETHFKENTHRDNCGRYHVRLPFNEKKELLGESREFALKRFTTLENKLARDQILKQQYAAFLDEYLSLGHMSEVTSSEITRNRCFLPHHAVLKHASSTTKLRVVFDASAKTTTGLSLNDTLMVGPTLQDDIFTIITRFRSHAYVLSADMEKMYRQVYVDARDAAYQTILWRDDHSKQLKMYSLNTVTYGTASASFLAIRALHQLADDESTTFPLGSKIIKRDLYMDDLLTGSMNLEEALRIRDEVRGILKAGGFNIRKWTSNDDRLTQSLKEQQADPHICLDSDSRLKTLGINWHPRDDTINYTVNLNATFDKITKRNILSQIATLFDPLGLLSPVIVKAKIIMQQLWLIKICWDESVPQETATMWDTYRSQLTLLNNLQISRRITIPNAMEMQLHGFCDASEVAYGACVYLRSCDANGKCTTRLVCAKTRVAPLKRLSLPRLELSAALLLSNLIRVTVESLGVKLDAVCCWSDSTIALCWIDTPPHRLKTFVANRVAQIQSSPISGAWRHVSSCDNPADIASRGSLPHEFINNALWFMGPSWLRDDESTWPRTKLNVNSIPELKTCTVLGVTLENDLLMRFSTLRSMKRVLAYCCRFLRSTRERDRQTGALTGQEIETTMERVIRVVQSTSFRDEIRSLIAAKPLNRRSKILSLSPFIDASGILRVGGRLKNAFIPYAAKHPILLPNSHHIADLVIRDVHVKQMHAGVQCTLYGVRQTYWIVDGKNRVKKIIRQCLECFRAAPHTPNYQMSHLPRDRLTSCRPFEIAGIDYCGPFAIKEKKYRNRNTVKIYVAIFVCFNTKAIHIEIVGDLSTATFLACLRRFFARRGKSRIIYSDNASNFVGARNELSELYNTIKSDSFKGAINHFSLEEGIEWKFIPPRSPHFGGLWESAVRSFKHHMRRVVGSTLLTYEEFNTFVVEVESILNSRPITTLSADPNDLLPLCPSHFLIGDSLLSLPSQDFGNTPTNRLSAWQHIQKIKQDFWKRWKNEYLNELNQRSKWFSNTAPNLDVGRVVLLREDNAPPSHWTLGRVIEVHPGSDGVVRVVTVKTNHGNFKRSVKKLSPLPTEEVVK